MNTHVSLKHFGPPKSSISQSWAFTPFKVSNKNWSFQAPRGRKSTTGKLFNCRNSSGHFVSADTFKSCGVDSGEIIQSVK